MEEETPITVVCHPSRDEAYCGEDVSAVITTAMTLMEDHMSHSPVWAEAPTVSIYYNDLEVEHRLSYNDVKQAYAKLKESDAVAGS